MYTLKYLAMLHMALFLKISELLYVQRLHSEKKVACGEFFATVTSTVVVSVTHVYHYTLTHLSSSVIPDILYKSQD